MWGCCQWDPVAECIVMWDLALYNLSSLGLQDSEFMLDKQASSNPDPTYTASVPVRRTLSFRACRLDRMHSRGSVSPLVYATLHACCSVLQHATHEPLVPWSGTHRAAIALQGGGGARSGGTNPQAPKHTPPRHTATRPTQSRRRTQLPSTRPE